jgi:hypothetical protein
MRKLLFVVVLALVIGFAAEPSTSTEHDMKQGRGVRVTLQGSAKVVNTSVSTVPSTSGPLAVPAAALLALLLMLQLSSGRHEQVDRLSRDEPWRLSSPLRGPPVLV